jgi:glycosyltransferase involved in cell wall biosynthesis
MKFSFVLLTWNRYRFLEICLEALVQSIAESDQCEVIVMDNGSTDGTGTVLERYRDSTLVRVIRLDKNYGINGYKKLFEEAKGEYIVTVDDDVLKFPPNIDHIFSEYMESFPGYGYLALNVVQNEFTNGAKPGPELYTAEVSDGKTVLLGPAGGWCACFRRSDFRKIRLRFKFFRLNMKLSEDGFITWNFKRKLHLKCGIIQDAVCLHACGPYYAQQYGHLDREIEKYSASGLRTFVEEYKKFQK